MSAPPMTDLSYQILLSLVSGPLHGYGILKAIEARSPGTGAPETGTLYTAIRRLRSGGLIRVADEGRGRRGRAYRLAPEGEAAVRSESRRLAALVAEARQLDLVDRST